MTPRLPLFALLVLASLSRAQIPDGSYVTSAFRVGAYIAPAGLFAVDRQQGIATMLGNLPPEVTGAAWPTAVIAGPDFVVLIRDGQVVTNGLGVSGVQLPVFFMTLQGLSVASSVRYDVGTITSASSRGIPQAHALRSGAVVIAVDDRIGVAGEPLFGALLGVVDPGVGPPGTPGAVSAIPVSPRPAGEINALAVDEAGGWAYLGMIDPSSPSAVWRVPFPAGGAPVQVGTLVDTLTGLAVDNDGTVLMTATGSGGLHRLDPSNGQVTRIAPNVNNLNGVAVERVTGEYVVATGAPSSGVSRIAPNGSVTSVSTGQPGGWGTLDGVAVAPAPATYGDGTRGVNRYFWALAPNPGGLPEVGNTSFSLTVVSTPGRPLATAALVGLGAASPPVSILGIDILVDPFQPLLTVALPGTFVATLPLPIANDPTLRGLSLFFQSLHVESIGLAASDGLRLTIL